VEKGIYKSGFYLVRRLSSLAPLVTLGVLVLIFTIASPTFFTATNLLNISAQISILAIVAAGMTFVIIAAEIDLSVANVAIMSGVLMALFNKSELWLVGGQSYVSAFAAVIIAVILGIISGVFVTRLRLPSFVVTLAMMQISKGITLVITGGKPLYTIPDQIARIGSGGWGPLPYVTIIALVTVLLSHIALQKLHFGRYVYAVGGNRTAAKLAGIRTDIIITSCFAISSLAAGIGGVLNVGRLGSAQTFGSEDLLIDSLAAVVIGGTSLFGGVGGIGNTVLGVAILGVLNNGLNQIRTNIFAKYLIKGIILLLALTINIISMRLKEQGELLRQQDFLAEGKGA